MQLGIVDSTGEKLGDEFEKLIFKKVEGVIFKKKTALDPFDALAFLKQFEKMDQRVVIVKLPREDNNFSEAFFDGLANLEATTGKIVFKCIYYDDQDGKTAVEEAADQFLEYLFKVKKQKEEETSEEMDVVDDDLPDPELLIK